MGSLRRLKQASLLLKMCSKVALLLLIASTASASSLYGGYGYPWSYGYGWPYYAHGYGHYAATPSAYAPVSTGWASAGTVPVAAGTYTPPDYAAASYDPVATAWNSVGTVPVRGGYSSAYAPVVSSYPWVSHLYSPAHTTSAYGQVIYSHPTGYMASRASAHVGLGEREGYSSYPVVSSYPAHTYYPVYAPAHTTSAYGQVTYSHPTGYMASRVPAYEDLGDRDAYSGSYATPVTSYPVYAYHPGFVSYGNEYGLPTGYTHALAYDENSLTRIPYKGNRRPTKLINSTNPRRRN